MKILTILVAIFVCGTAQAQFGKDFLNRTQENALRKVNAKADQKADQGIDKVLDAPETAVKKKKEKKKADAEKKAEEEKSGEATTTDAAEQPAGNSMEGEGARTVIQTNIRCEAGRKKVEAALKKQDGVFEVKTNIKNGELSVRYSSDGTSYTTLLELINKQGFEADGSKPTSGKPGNPCK